MLLPLAWLPHPLSLATWLIPKPISRPYEATLSRHLSFFEGHGWANDWVTNFRNIHDTIIWKVNVVRDGIYRVSIQMATTPAETG